MGGGGGGEIGKEPGSTVFIFLQLSQVSKLVNEDVDLQSVSLHPYYSDLPGK